MTDLERGRVLGGLDVANQLMNWLNSQEELMIHRKDIQKKLMKVRPKPLKEVT